MVTRSRAALAVIVASVALLAYVIFGSSDEDKVLLRVKELANAVETRSDESLLFRTARIDRAFKESLEPDATFRAPELPSKQGLHELVLLAAEAGQTFGAVRLSVGATDVHVERDVAHAVSEITLTSERGNELHGDRRSVRFELRRAGGDFRVSSIDVASKSGEPPEARP